MKTYYLQQYLIGVVLLMGFISCANDDNEVVAGRTLDFAVSPAEFDFDWNRREMVPFS